MISAVSFRVLRIRRIPEGLAPYPHAKAMASLPTILVEFEIQAVQPRLCASTQDTAYPVIRQSVKAHDGLVADGYHSTVQTLPENNQARDD